MHSKVVKAGFDVCFFLMATRGASMPLAMAQVSMEKPVLVKNINARPANEPLVAAAELNGVLIFTAWTPGSGWELWRSDGSERNAVRVKDINPGPASALEPAQSHFATSGGVLFLPRMMA